MATSNWFSPFDKVILFLFHSSCVYFPIPIPPATDAKATGVAAPNVAIVKAVVPATYPIPSIIWQPAPSDLKGANDNSSSHWPALVP